MEFSDLLTDEHRAIRKALEVLKAMADQVKQGTSIDKHDVNALLIFLHYFADSFHQSNEENILFPALKSCAKYQDSRKQLEGLMEEHTEQRELIEETQFLLFTDRRDEFIVSAQKLIQMISEHAIEEERVLLPLAERILPADKAQTVAMQIREANARFGSTQRRLLLDMLQVLQEKYLRKAA